MAKGKDEIIYWATELFSSEAYENVAISQICKAAKVSNGLFYKYFRNKEELFKYLLEETANIIDRYCQEVRGDSLEERLESFVRINFLFTKNELSIIKVFREGQYKFLEYEKILKQVYLKALDNIFGRRLDEYEYIYVMSGIRYINVNFILRNRSLDSKFLTKIILNGFFEKESPNIEKFKDINLYIRVLFNSSNLKTQLLIEGEKLLGKKGIFHTKVHEISNLVNVGVGSFYYHYETKEDFLKEIGNDIKNTVIFFLKDNLWELEERSPMVKHLFFLYLMLKYFQNAPYKYQIMRELEFIEPDIHKSFTDSLEKLYLKVLEDTAYTNDEKLVISYVLLGIAHYTGLEFFFLENLKSEEEFLEKMSYFMVNGVNNKQN